MYNIDNLETAVHLKNLIIKFMSYRTSILQTHPDFNLDFEANTQDILHI